MVGTPTSEPIQHNDNDKFPNGWWEMEKEWGLYLFIYLVMPIIFQGGPFTVSDFPLLLDLKQIS